LPLEDPVYQALLRYTRALAVALGCRDPHTRIHSERVLGLCEAMGARAGLTARERGILRIAATFHDVGKIGIPDQILLKPARLDEGETLAMRRHAELGAAIVLATELDGAGEVARAVRHHHEHFDGGGYPDGIAGEDIPASARIIGIADSYDAMAQARAYHRPRGHAEIMGILHQETGRKHDPGLARIFQEVIERCEYRSVAD
jgi:HD-GYP domain-containing protein (c-di-GMP phosphodiesterase class II)